MDPRIEQLLRRAAKDDRLIGLAGGLPATAQFPRHALGQAFLHVLAQPAAAALQYGWPEGSPALRGWIAARLRRRGADVDPDDVLVTSGAQQAIALAVQLTARRGGRVGVDPETYPAALDLFRIRGLRPAAGTDAPLVYVMPEVSNPRGQRLSDAERARLVGSGAWLVEDDAYAELRFDGGAGRPLLADAPERVLHVGTLSKSLSPGLRLGWLVVPARLRARAIRAKHAADLQPSSLAQAVVEAFLETADFDAHLVRLRRFYRRRARRLEAALTRELPGWRFQTPVGGFALWAEPERHFSELGFLQLASAAGVSFDPGSSFRASRATRPLALRLCYSSVDDEADLDQAARRLARAWRWAS